MKKAKRHILCHIKIELNRFRDQVAALRTNLHRRTKLDKLALPDQHS